MQVENTLKATFFIATIGVMLFISGIIFIIYCFSYEVKNKKKLYKEAKMMAFVAVMIGIIMTMGSLLYLNNII